MAMRRRCAEARQAAHQLGQTVAVVGDLEAIEHSAGGVDDAHRVRVHRPVQAGKHLLQASVLMDRLLEVAV